AAADRPEEIGLVVSVDAPHGAVRSHDLGRDEVVDGEPVLAHEIADTATQRDATEADGAGVAEADAEAVRARGGRELDRGPAGLGPRRPRRDVDLDAPHVVQVEDDPALRED